MFSSYRAVFWLSVVMALFVFAPFYVTGFSTDVWTRLARIAEWSRLGFPWHEYLTAEQNFPFGQELHWTRPLDFLGYAFAWPFIPTWGLKTALEIMATFTPIIVLLIGIRGYFYGMRGYVSPKIAFLGFWLFFYAIGYVWGQAAPGYYDHHVFHFTLLMWVIALTARSFLTVGQAKLCLMAAAGVLTALGTWITAEFAINMVFVALPFAFWWLLFNTSLKALTVYFCVYTLVCLLALSFDHPMSGFMTLDIYRFSLFHAILGGIFTGICLILESLFRIIQTSVFRRLIYGVLMVSITCCALLIGFQDIIFRPMTDPVVYHLWVKKVTEMSPLTNDWPSFFRYVILTAPVVVGMMVSFIQNHIQKRQAILLTVLSGLVFYTTLMVFHVRVGISVDAFFIWTAVFFLNDVFFPREKSVKLTLIFIVFYALFMGTTLKGKIIMERFIKFGVDHYKEAYENNPDIELPTFLKDEFLKEKAKNEEKELTLDAKVNALFNQRPEDETYSCKTPESAFKVLKEHPVKGGVLTDIFQAPQVLWESGRPVWGGPYHDMIAPHLDLIRVFFDEGPDFKVARRLLEYRQTKLIFMTHPGCMVYLFWNDKAFKKREGLDAYFYFKTYYELPGMPKWLKRIYYDEPSGVKIFEVIEDHMPRLQP